MSLLNKKHIDSFNKSRRANKERLKKQSNVRKRVNKEIMLTLMIQVQSKMRTHKGNNDICCELQ